MRLKRAYLLLLVPLLSLILFYLAGLFWLFRFSLHESLTYGAGPAEGVYTAENFFIFFTTPHNFGNLLQTLYISGSSTLLAIVLGYPIGYTIARVKSTRIRGLLLVSVIISLFVSTIVQVYAFLIILGPEGMVNGFLMGLGLIGAPLRMVYNEFGVIVGLARFLLPFAILSLAASIKNISADYEDAARNLGADELQTFTRVTLPLSVPGIVAATLLSFSLGAAAFVTPILLGGGGVNMMSNRVWSLVYVVGDLPFAATMSMLLLALTLITAFAIGRALEVGVTMGG